MFDFLKSSPEGEKKGGGKLILLLLCAVAGVLLLLVGSGSKPTETTAPEPVYDVSEDEVVIYQKHLEERIRTLCQSVRGVGNVTVAVTLGGTFESVYATQTQGSNEVYVIVGSGSSAQALYLTRSTPQITGIGIVCTGGNVESVRCELISLLSATFDVSAHRIYVAQAYQ